MTSECGRRCPCAVLLLIVVFQSFSFAQAGKKIPDRVPPKRTSQIQDGFGINSDLPRDPLSPLEPLVVDTHVRCRLQVDSNRPVREQF